MISSRWPRPIGMSEFDRLQSGRHRLVHRLARNDAGRLDVDAHALVGLDRALAVDRIAERVDHAAEQALADRHVDDGAGALDGLAFLDLAVVAEDHDADVVDFEVERHAADAVLELDHLAGLHVVEAVDAGDAVADRQHLADFGDLGLLAEILDLVFQDRGDFCGADIHQPASFIACLIALSLVRSERIDHAGAELDRQPADDRRIDLDVEIDRLLAGDRLERALDRLKMSIGQLFGGGDLGGHLALPFRNQLAEVADHVAHREQPPVGGHEQQEVRSKAADAGLGQHCGRAPGLAPRRRTPGCGPGEAGLRSRQSWRRNCRDRPSPRRPIWRRARARTARAHSGPPCRKRSCLRLPRVRALENQIREFGAGPEGAAQTLGFQGSFVIPGTVANPAKSRGSRNISILAVQHAVISR